MYMIFSTCQPLNSVPVYCNFLTCMPGAIFHICMLYIICIPWVILIEHYKFLKGFAFILFVKGIADFENNLNGIYLIYILHQAHK
jgi:hypothetical protein